MLNKRVTMLNKLIKISDKLDQAGLTREADVLDLIIEKVAQSTVSNIDKSLMDLSPEEISTLLDQFELSGLSNEMTQVLSKITSDMTLSPEEIVRNEEINHNIDRLIDHLKYFKDAIKLYKEKDLASREGAPELDYDIGGEVDGETNIFDY